MTMTAILAVAVACYSRVTGAEEGTIAALRTVSRELANFEIAEPRGRIVKTTLAVWEEESGTPIRRRNEPPCSWAPEGILLVE
jgi:hypothetical protein